jgi:hypothetical protein
VSPKLWLPHPSRFSKGEHHGHRHQATFLTRSSAFWVSFTSTGTRSPISEWRKLLHAHRFGSSTGSRFTGFHPWGVNSNGSGRGRPLYTNGQSGRPLLKSEKWRTPSCFCSTFRKCGYTPRGSWPSARASFQFRPEETVSSRGRLGAVVKMGEGKRRSGAANHRSGPNPTKETFRKPNPTAPDQYRPTILSLPSSDRLCNTGDTVDSVLAVERLWKLDEILLSIVEN